MEEVNSGWSLPTETVVEILSNLAPLDYVSCLRASSLFVRDTNQYQRKFVEHRGKWFLTREQSIREDLCLRYIVHDNGGEPWWVHLQGGNIHIDTRPFDWNFYFLMCNRNYKDVCGGESRTMEEYNETALFQAARYDFETDDVKRDQRVMTIDDWIGMWAPEDCADERGGCAGNTLLVQLPNEPDGRYHYIMITGSIEEFWTTQPIRRFESPIGNSDVPYPFGLTGDSERTEEILFLLPEEMTAIAIDNPHTLRSI